MEFTEEKLARIWLQSAPMGAWNKINALKEKYGGALGVWNHFSPGLYDSLGESAYAMLADLKRTRCREITRALEQLSAKVLFFGESSYPLGLSAIDHAPDVLFLRGTLPAPHAPAIAIVGSRRSTRYGSSQARRIARELAEKGVTIVSGLARGFAGCEQVEFQDFVRAFDCAREDAYKAILTPTEGTILTVIHEASRFLLEHGGEYQDLRSGFEALLQQMKKTLQKTPELLPILKESGVVDSGGAGLVCFVEGMVAYLSGKTVEDTPELSDALPQSMVTGSFGPDSVLEYGYCTEFILQLMHAKTDISAFDLKAFLKPLEDTSTIDFNESNR